MENDLKFDFLVDKENSTITVRREFAADVSLVWDAFTKPQLLDQWWGPKPWKAKTKSMEFREGGTWLYAMVGPEGEQHWSVFKYQTIEKPKHFTAVTAFTDASGVLNAEMPRSTRKISFTVEDGTTVVEARLGFEKPEDLETMIQMHFREGFAMGLQQLEKLLPELQERK
jgi:uncharacterized protein YndB with AHSA1/START domain